MKETTFEPDYHNIVCAAENKKSSRIPLYEHCVSPRIMETLQGSKFADLFNGNYQDKVEFFRHFCGFYRDNGYDTVSYECCVVPIMPGGGALGGALGRQEEGVIKTRSDFDAYPWEAIPERFFEIFRINYRALEEAMPQGMKAIGGVGNGVFECVQDLVGFQQLCYISADDKDLYADLFIRVGDMMVQIWERFLAEFGDLFCVCRTGDDLGFKTSTLLSAGDIRSHIIPQYKRVVDIAHSHGKPFLLHSCGCIFSVMDDLINDAHIDAKHSNEDVISPYSRWIDDYGAKIGNFGGLDTDVLCNSNTVDVVQYTSDVYRLCESKGRGVAIGSGNSIPDYVDPGRYSLMLDTVRRLRGN